MDDEALYGKQLHVIETPRHRLFRRETNIEQSWGKGVKNRAGHP
jgi:hypothetical protein